MENFDLIEFSSKEIKKPRHYLIQKSFRQEIAEFTNHSIGKSINPETIQSRNYLI